MTLSALQALNVFPGKERIMSHISIKRSSSRRERRFLQVQGGGKGPNTVIPINFQCPWKKVFSPQQRTSEGIKTHWILSHKKTHGKGNNEDFAARLVPVKPSSDEQYSSDDQYPKDSTGLALSHLGS